VTVEEIELAAWVAAPWGAGQGTTHEIRRWPDGSGGYIARASVAEIVASGPFTPLAGFRRWLAVLDAGGGGLALAIGARTWRGDVGETVWFDGAEPVHATLLGSSLRVFNLIAREHLACSGAWHREACALTLPSGVAVVHTVATGHTRVITRSQPIEIAVDSAPAIVVHLGLGC
jgi:environmental stress-induced protein Ves